MLSDCVPKTGKAISKPVSLPTVRSRLINGTAFNLLATFFNQGSTLAANIIVARILMRQGFGEYAMVQSTLLTMAMLAQLATGSTAAKYVAEYRAVDPEKAGRIMGLCAIISLVAAALTGVLLVAMAPWLATAVLKAPQLAVPLMIGSAFLLFSSLNGYQTGALSGLEAYRSLAKAGVISGVIAVMVIPLGAWMGGLNGTIAGLSTSAVLRCIIHNRWLRRESRAQGIRIQHCGIAREKTVLTRFALPGAIAGYYSLPTLWLASAFLARQSDGYGELALYSAANGLRVLVLFLPNVMNNVSLSVLNHEKARGDILHYHRVFKANVMHIAGGTLCAAAVVGVVGRPALELFGKEFGEAHVVLWLLLLSTLFQGLSVALFQYIQSLSRIWLSLFAVTIPRDTLYVTAAYFLVPLYGGTGLAMAYLGSWILCTVCILLCIRLLRREKCFGDYPPEVCEQEVSRAWAFPR